MPELYGNERKDKIRADRARLRRELSKEQVEHTRTRRDLRLARAKITEQRTQLEVIKQFLHDALQEADRNIAPAVVKRYEESFEKEVDELGCVDKPNPDPDGRKNDKGREALDEFVVASCDAP
jgi:hypothetical protein